MKIKMSLRENLYPLLLTKGFTQKQAAGMIAAGLGVFEKVYGAYAIPVGPGFIFVNEQGVSTC